MPNKIVFYLTVLVILVLPAILMAVEYSRVDPASQHSPPFHGVHVEEGALGQITWISNWSWARIFLRWDEIELQPGRYDWDARVDEGITLLKNAGAPLLITIITTPDWARQYPEVRCSPPLQKYIDNYAEFANAVIDRYQPHAIELTNEPEVPVEVIGNLDKWMGCWGPEGDYYAEMLKVVYPHVKGRNPEVIVLAGSLMLDDDQDDFWKDVLAAGAGGYYDGLSFHGYVYYPLNEYGLLDHKVALLRSLGETAPLWLTETRMLCYDEYIDCGVDFELAQAEYYDYLVQSYSEIGVERFFWFTVANNYWRYSDLVEGDEPRAAWYEYIKTSSILRRGRGGWGQ